MMGFGEGANKAGRLVEVIVKCLRLWALPRSVVNMSLKQIFFLYQTNLDLLMGYSELEGTLQFPASPPFLVPGTPGD